MAYARVSCFNVFIISDKNYTFFLILIVLLYSNFPSDAYNYAAKIHRRSHLIITHGYIFLESPVMDIKLVLVQHYIGGWGGNSKYRDV